MKRRPLGATGITVSEIGLGAWQLANPDWGAHDVGEARRVVEQALAPQTLLTTDAPHRLATHPAALEYGGATPTRLSARRGVHG